MKLRKTLAALLAFVMTAAFSSCSSSGSESSKSSTSTGNSGGSASAVTDDGSVVTEKGVLPIVKEGKEVKLSLFMGGLPTTVSSYDYKDNLFTQKVVDETGIQLEFVTTTKSDADSKLNLLLSSNDYPDVINYQMDMNTVELYASEGIFVPIDEYIEKYGVNIPAVYEETPGVLNVSRQLDGKIYGAPTVSECYHCVFGMGRMWYYQPWVDEYNLKLPETLDEFTEFLIAIRDGDFNKNGKKDEIPLACTKEIYDQFIYTIANFFLPYTESGYIIQDGESVPQFTDSRFKEALAYMNFLYTEGLVNQDMFTIDIQTMQMIGESEEGPMVGAEVGYGRDLAVQKDGPSGRWFHFFGLPPVEGPDGVRYNISSGFNSIGGTRWYITDKCEYPEAAFRLADYMLDFDVYMSMYIGPKGQCWDDPDPGALGLNGEPALYKLLVKYESQPENSSWEANGLVNLSSRVRLGEQVSDEETMREFLETGDSSLIPAMQENPSFNEYANYYFAKTTNAPYAIPDELIMPPVLYTEEQSTRRADIRAVINDYMWSTWVDFITGEKNLDAEWDAYLAQLENMGLEELCQIQTDAYQAKYMK